MSVIVDIYIQYYSMSDYLLQLVYIRLSIINQVQVQHYLEV